MSDICHADFLIDNVYLFLYNIKQRMDYAFLELNFLRRRFLFTKDFKNLDEIFQERGQTPSSLLSYISVEKFSVFQQEILGRQKSNKITLLRCSATGNK